jgi:hypothetical protein
MPGTGCRSASARSIRRTCGMPREVERVSRI